MDAELFHRMDATFGPLGEELLQIMARHLPSLAKVAMPISDAEYVGVAEILMGSCDIQIARILQALHVPHVTAVRECASAHRMYADRLDEMAQRLSAPRQ